MSKQTERVQALRRGSYVKRCHTYHLSREYLVGQHSFNMLQLYLELCPKPNVNTIRAIQLHDTPEEFTGDTPWQAKNAAATKIGPSLKTALANLEEDWFDHYGIRYPYKDLSLEDEAWLKGLDMVEFTMTMGDEVWRGNQEALPHYNRALDILWEAKLPPELGRFVADWFVKGS